MGSQSAEILGAQSVLHMLVSMALVVAFFFLVAWMLRRWGRLATSGSGVLRLIAVRSLGPRERIVLLQVGDEQLLVGVAPGRIQTLHVMRQPVDVVPPVAATGHPFSLHLQHWLRTRN